MTCRALAESWENEPHHAMSTYKTPVDSISLFVLLDLLGSAQPFPRVPSYFQTTHWAYVHMAAIERRLRELKELETSPPAPFLPDENKKPPAIGRGYVEDDHIPFMLRGVDILHIIPTPFPDVWHHMTDDGPHLDLPTVRDWARIVTAFAAEWMDLEGYMPPAAKEKVKRVRSDKTEL
jgi:glutaminyl-peptide cyclotransferase